MACALWWTRSVSSRMSRRFDAWILNFEAWWLTRVYSSNEEPSTLWPVYPTIIIRLHVERLSHHHDAPIEVKVMRNDACILGLLHAQWICRNSRTVPSEYLFGRTRMKSIYAAIRAFWCTRTRDGSLTTPSSSTTITTLLDESCRTVKQRSQWLERRYWAYLGGVSSTSPYMLCLCMRQNEPVGSSTNGMTKHFINPSLSRMMSFALGPFAKVMTKFYAHESVITRDSKWLVVHEHLELLVVYHPFQHIT